VRRTTSEENEPEAPQPADDLLPAVYDDLRRLAAAWRPEADRLVEPLWREKNPPAEVVAALRADPALGEPLRRAALRAVPQRALHRKPHRHPTPPARTRRAL
jgi:hypothetical protein